MWSFNHTQLQCYAVMKLILKEFVKTKCAEKYKSVLCSYFIKTFLFWQFENMDRSFWRIINLIGCIIYLFNEFNRCIQTGVLRHYFVPRFNLLEIKLTPDAQTDLLKIFGKVIETGISIIEQSKSLSRVFYYFIAIRGRRHCEMRTAEIYKRRILDNDEITMRLLTIEIFYQIQNASFSYDSLFAVFLRLSSGRYSTSLVVFAIRSVCRLIVLRTLCNSSHHCNRYLHYRMTALSKNIYGTDLATSKLWLATFLLHQGDYAGSLQNVNNVLSSIPPYALYYSGRIMSGDDSIDRYCGRNTDILCRAKEAWLFDLGTRKSRKYRGIFEDHSPVK